MAERLFYVRGEVDIASADVLHATFDDAVAFDDADLIVDCSGLTFMDSSGLSVLIATQRDLQALGRNMRITNATGGIRRIMQVAGLSELLHVNEGTGASHAATA